MDEGTIAARVALKMT